MLIKVLTPCHATSEFFATVYKYFIESCGKFNIDFEVYGIGAPYYPSRLFNTVTGSYPCMLHLPGGYSDPNSGKLDLVKGWYEQF